MHLGIGTPGITDPMLSAEPLGTEGELTPGPDDYVPYDDPEYWAAVDAEPPTLPELEPIAADFPVDDFPRL